MLVSPSATIHFFICPPPYLTSLLPLLLPHLLSPFNNKYAAVYIMHIIARPIL